MTDNKRPRAAPVKPIIWQMLTERDGQPVTSMEVSKRAGVTRMTGWQALCRAVKAGEIHALAVGHDHLYFRDARDADKYSQRQVAEFAAAQAKARADRLLEANKRLGRWPAKGAKTPRAKPQPKQRKANPAPVTIKRQAEATQVDYSRAKITRVAAPLGRFEVDPSHRGPFSLVGIGRDVETGSDWGAK